MIVDLEKVVGLDMSAWAAFERLARRFQEQGDRFVLTGLSPHLGKRFNSWIGSDVSNLEIAENLDDILEGIEEQLLAQHPSDQPADARGMGKTSREREDVAAALERYGDRMQLAPGDVVLAEGATADHLLVLLSGRLRVTVTNRKGLAITVNRLLPGAILGEVGYYANVPRTARVVAETPVTALRIDAKSLSRMEYESPSQAAAFHRNLAGILARRLINSTQLLKEAEV